MAAKKAQVSTESVTLLFTDVFTPYAKGEVATFAGDVAELILETEKAVKFDAENADHAAALVAQRGKA